ncbi:MAG: S8 family serine peptidase, partial [Solirubrobacterales bacterium]
MDTEAGSLPFDGRSPLVPPAKEMRVLVELRRPSLATQAAGGAIAPGRQRAYVSSLRNEVRALRSALEAKGVRLRRPVLYARVWNGFAATVDTADLPEVRALGLRAEPVRRFYGAASAVGSAQRAVRRGQPVVALLDSSGRHGSDIEQVLAQALGPHGGGILRIPVAGPQRDPATGARTEYGTTDQLLTGFERTVDPNGDGDTSDHLPVALVGVNSPYAGFADSPEAVAAGAARALGTLVVAPAGNEGPGAGTVGSPAAAPGVLAVGALDGGGAPALSEVRIGLATSEGRALLRGTLLGGTGRALRAEVETLAGPSQASPRERGRSLGGSPLEYFGVDAEPRAKGRVVIVPARRTAADGPSLSVRAAAAAESGAAALIVCEPDSRRHLTAIPGADTTIPVIGLSGTAARRALDLTRHGGGLAFVSAPRARSARGSLTPATTSSRGPSYALAPKPDIAAPGTARVGSGGLVAGTSVAAARVGAAAVAVHAR